MTRLDVFNSALADLDSTRITPIGQTLVLPFTGTDLDIVLHNCSEKLRQLRRHPENADFYKDLAAYCKIATMILDEIDGGR